MLDISDCNVVEFQVVLMIKTATGKNITYKSPAYKIIGQHGFGPTLLQMIMTRRLPEWIEAAMKEINDDKG